MKITTKGRYGLRIMLELTKHYVEKKGSLVDLKTIGEIQKLPVKYLEHIVRVLMKKGLIQSLRGVNGGYKLKKNPQDIYVFDILEACEHISTICPCVNEKNCPFLKVCGMCDVWEGLKKVIVKYLSSVSIFDVYKMCKEKNKV